VDLARPWARLDVGAGQGALLDDLAVALPSAQFSGADVSERALDDCRARFPQAEFFAMNLVDPEFETIHAARLARFDLVVCSEVIEHIEADDLALRRLESLLVPGGTLVVSVPGGRMSRFDEAIGHQRHYDVDRLRSLVQTAHFDVLDVFAWGFPFQNLYRTAVRVAARAALPQGPSSATDAAAPGIAGRALGAGYQLFGATLKPLFYLNLSRWGEQLFAVARAP
jgi:SAM-dependent methyltransferase